MANEQRQSSEPWTLETVPFIILILIASHILALVSNSKTTSKEEGTLSYCTIHNRATAHQFESILMD
uniref:Uncharacterized protein n=1 Tax=Cucumis melo TaxID=3656 RepID=A0A9I9E8K4_CUCME